jgi:CDP-glucose 4,6-dehydratase
MAIFNDIYRNRKVFITGNTGFNGSWLALWLLRMGAMGVGYSLSPPTEPSHFALIHLPMDSFIGGIRDTDKLDGYRKLH